MPSIVAGGPPGFDGLVQDDLAAAANGPPAIWRFLWASIMALEVGRQLADDGLALVAAGPLDGERDVAEEDLVAGVDRAAGQAGPGLPLIHVPLEEPRSRM
jgi:hypothetical protein